jgi:hypothetical protein
LDLLIQAQIATATTVHPWLRGKVNLDSLANGSVTPIQFVSHIRQEAGIIFIASHRKEA